MKTLALFCMLHEHGCSIRTTVHVTEYPIIEDSDSESEADDGLNATCPLGISALVKHSQRSQWKLMDKNVCCGRLVMLYDHFNQYYIVYRIFCCGCEWHYWHLHSCQYCTHACWVHLIMHNLQEYNIEYFVHTPWEWYQHDHKAWACCHARGLWTACSLYIHGITISPTASLPYVFAPSCLLSY